MPPQAALICLVEENTSFAIYEACCVEHRWGSKRGTRASESFALLSRHGNFLLPHRSDLFFFKHETMNRKDDSEALALNRKEEEKLVEHEPQALISPSLDM